MADKKILKEEILNDEQLEQVAGGTYHQTAADSAFLWSLGLLDKWYSDSEIINTPSTKKEQKIYDAFQKLGIGFEWHGGWCSDNNYYVGQQCLTQAEAWKVALTNAKDLKLGWFKYQN